MKTHIGSKGEILEQSAGLVAALLKDKPEAAVALGANDDCLALYRLLAARARAGETELSQARFFQVAEFAGLSADDPNSCRSRLRGALLSAADPTGERSFFLSEGAEKEADARIEALGGLDLAILGIGERGRIGFNEPATPFDSTTHGQKLTRATRRELAALFGGEDQVPAFGLTLGIRSLTEAKRIFVLAFGEERADPVFRMLYARTDSFVPAAFLQLPSEVEVFLDSAAASKL